MKNFTKACLGLFAMIFVSSCSSTQHFSFSPAPPAYQKQKPTAPVLTDPQTESQNLTASAVAASVALPEVADLKADNSPAETKAVLPVLQKDEVTAKQKLTLVQKVALKKLQKQATKLERKVQQTKDITAGPISNRNAIALILIGLIAVLFGGLLSINVFYTLGTLIILIGLVLLVLNYL